MTNSINVGVISFPGSNGDHDALHAFEHQIGVHVRAIDYRQAHLDGVDAVVLPGGFSYGDALRCGAIARFAPIMASIKAFADAGGPVLGICNGFQILCEAQLLPGALLRNQSLRFHCFRTRIRIDQADTAWTRGVGEGAILTLPVAHGEGGYFIGEAGLAELEANHQVVARYCEADGTLSAKVNPNGSLNHIAAICNRQRNVVGLMPHPERAADPIIGGTDGARLLQSVLAIGNPAMT
jgi:phosphoribosylformylglycinamidine synthase